MNRLGCRFSFALAMSFVGTLALADYPAEVRRDQPVGYWRFCDDSAGEGRPAKDETGRHAGVYHGNVTLQAGPPTTGGKAAHFDGK